MINVGGNKLEITYDEYIPNSGQNKATYSCMTSHAREQLGEFVYLAHFFGWIGLYNDTDSNKTAFNWKSKPLPPQINLQSIKTKKGKCGDWKWEGSAADWYCFAKKCYRAISTDGKKHDGVKGLPPS